MSTAAQEAGPHGDGTRETPDRDAQEGRAFPRLLADTQALGLEQYLACTKCGISTLALSLVWLALTWCASGRPSHLAGLQEPLLAALIGGLTVFPARAVRAAVETSDQAELPHRSGSVWAAVDAHPIL